MDGQHRWRRTCDGGYGCGRAGARQRWRVKGDAKPRKYTEGDEACPQHQTVRRAPRRAHVLWCSRFLVGLAG
jgi:hypothetical protein